MHPPREDGRRLVVFAGVLWVGCGSGLAASRPGPSDSALQADEPTPPKPPEPLPPLPPSAPGVLPEIPFSTLRSENLADGDYRIAGFYLGPAKCPKGPPNAGLCAPRWILGARERVPDGVARSGELSVHGSYDVQGVALVREPGELAVPELVAGKKYLMIVAVREISATRFLSLRGARPAP